MQSALINIGRFMDKLSRNIFQNILIKEINIPVRDCFVKCKGTDNYSRMYM